LQFAALLELHDGPEPSPISLEFGIYIFLVTRQQYLQGMMATSFLPPIVPSPFGKSFGRKPYMISGIEHGCFNGVNGYHYDDGDQGSSPRTWRASSLPFCSIPSDNRRDSDENTGHCFYSEADSRSPTRRSYSFGSGQRRPYQSAKGSVRPVEKVLEHTETFPIFEDSLEHESGDMKGYTEAERSSDRFWDCAPKQTADSGGGVDVVPSNKAVGGLVPLPRGGCGASTKSTRILNRSIGRTTENFRRWASTFRHKKSAAREKGKQRGAETDVRVETAALVADRPLPSNWHQKRTSNASSRFVATVKTASMSNDSMSILPRSHRYSKVGDPRAKQSSDPRSSVDSARASSIASSDEGALRRSIKRRQVLQELLSSEESYVADLKALHNLFSTLLASIPTISSHTRNSIQRNVTDMLHIHEQIINELHRVALRATLREHRQASSPPGRGSRRNRRWQSLDASSCPASMIEPTHTGRRRPDATTSRRGGGSSAYAADPTEAAEAARAFKNHMACFFVYEEYCAKYEMMVQELSNSNKMVPHWQVYEAGMEALANSTASLNQRSNHGKKGLTAHDLLIKPIQRMCKYPLFFLDLYKNTPVVDCPSSHATIDGALANFRDMVREINLATDEPKVRERVQRRWLLQDRLNLGPQSLEAAQFRMLGHALLCGVLHVAYQTSNGVQGGYVLCMMFKDYLLVAAPSTGHSRLDILATIYLSDARVVSTEDGRGTQPLFCSVASC
jgi:RhoGEF domain